MIKNAAGEDKTANFSNVKKINGTLTVNKASVTIKTGSASKAYDGTALTKAEASIEGLVNGETATVTATGSQTEVGSSSNTYSIDWGKTKKDNYTITEELGTLEVTKNSAEVTLTAPSDSKTYDGTALTADGTGEKKVTASGLPEGFTVVATASGSQTDAGSSANVVNNGYVIKNAEGADKTANFSNVKKVDGTLTVNKAAMTINVIGNKDSKEYNGSEQKVEGFKLNSESKFYDKAKVSFSGSAVAAGTEVGTYPMGLKADQFSYSNANINVTFNVTDGELVITEAPEPGPGPDDDDPEPGPDDDEPEPEPGPDDDDPTPVPGDDDEPTPGDDDEPTPVPVPGGDEPTPVPGGGPDIVPVNPQPVPVPPAEPTIDDDPTPRTDPVPTEPETETIPSDPTPKGKPMKVWALLNLILSIITVILGIIMVITFAIGKKDDDENEDKEHVEKMARAEGEGAEDEDEKKKHRNALKFLGLIPAIGTVILFLLTEDMTAKMVFTDWWTIPTAIITLIAIVLMIVIKNKKNKQEDEEKPEEV